MSKIIIVEPDITDEENQRNWEKINDIINAIADELEIEMYKEKKINLRRNETWKIIKKQLFQRYQLKNSQKMK